MNARGQVTQLTEFDRNRRIEWLQDQLTKNPHRREMIEAAILKLQAAAVEVELPGNDGYQWHLMRRDNGSICLYWTQANDPAQYIVWDSLDNS